MSGLLARLLQKLRRDRGLPLGLRLQKALLWVQGQARARVLLRACDSVGARARALGAVRVRNGGRVVLGRDLVFDARLSAIELASDGGTLRLGDDVFVNFGTRLRATQDLTLGSRCDLGPHCVLEAAGAAITLGDDVWLGARVTVLAGAAIGPGAVVAAGSVVEGTLPGFCVAGGRPARVLKHTQGRGGSRASPGTEAAHADRPEAARADRPEDAAAGIVPRFVLTDPEAALDEAPRGRAPFSLALRSRLALRSADFVGPGARVLGSPLIRNDGALRIGARLHLASAPARSHLVVASGARLTLGDDVRIGAGAGISAHASVAVGAGSSLGPGAMLLDFDFHGVEERDHPEPPRPIEIGREVRIGARAIVLRGVRIGDGAQIADDSVVVRDVPAGARVAGAPARVVDGSAGDASAADPRAVDAGGDAAATAALIAAAGSRAR